MGCPAASKEGGATGDKEEEEEQSVAGVEVPKAPGGSGTPESPQQRVTRSRAAKEGAGASPASAESGGKGRGGGRGQQGGRAAAAGAKGRRRSVGASKESEELLPPSRVKVPDLTEWRKAQALYPVIVGPEP